MAGRIISQEDKQYLLSLQHKDFFKNGTVNYDLLIDLFGSKTVKNQHGQMTISKPRFDPTDEFTLNPGECNENKDKVRTTVGQLVYNKLLFGNGLYKIVGYVNRTMNSKAVGQVEAELASALVDDEITTEDFIQYLDNFQTLSLGFHHVIASSFTMRGLKPIPKVIKHRDQLLKEHEKEIASGDALVVANIEKILVKEAEEILHDEPSLALYRSGARGSMGNNYKCISIMKGPVQNPITGKFDTVSTSFMEGIDKQSIAPMGNGVVGGAYPKAVGTAKGGYKFKEMSAALQAIVVDEPGSDCGSKGYIMVTITDKNKSEYLNRFIIEGGKLVQLDNKTLSKYI